MKKCVIYRKKVEKIEKTEKKKIFNTLHVQKNIENHV